jgi:hypothetical protein
VWKTTNGGTNWTNISTGLPNIPANAGIHGPGTVGDVYLGMDDGVYHFDHVAGVWERYSDYLPRAVVTDLVWYHPLNRLHATTFGRGIWFSPIIPSALDDAQEGQPQLTVYQHPQSGEWVLRYRLGATDAGTLRISDVQGRELLSAALHKSEGEMRDIARNWAAGMYLVQVYTEEGSARAKILIPE